MIACLVAGILTGASGRLAAANPMPLLNDPIDVSGDFRDFSDLYYLADRLAAFDPATGTGKITVPAFPVFHPAGLRQHAGRRQTGGAE